MNTQKKRTVKSVRISNFLLRTFLLISIAGSFILISNCKEGNGITNPDDLSIRPPEFGGDESGSWVTSLFTSVAEGAAGEIGGAGASWVLSAIGLGAASGPDYTAQLNKIHQDLQEVISQLNGIENELSKINDDLLAINCSEWSTTLSDEKARILSLLTDYQTFIATARDTGIVTNDQLSDWVDQVLAINNYSGQESMDQILSKYYTTLISAPGTGVIPACIKLLSAPAHNSFGDTTYYKNVTLFINYYYAFQVRALFLYNEAKHYQAWVAAGSPDSTFLSADSVAYVCSDARAKEYCLSAVNNTNELYNNLIEQLTISGAPFTDENFVTWNNQSDGYLFIKSLEEFTTAAGDNCATPLTSAKPCGITAGRYDTGNLRPVVYKGYTNWLKAGSNLIENLVSGWTTGTAGDYLEDSLGFKNMKNKIVISTNTVKIDLSNSETDQDFVVFFDTDPTYDFMKGLVKNQSQYDFLAPSTYSTPCYVDDDFTKIGHKYTYNMNSELYSFNLNRNNFYNLNATVGFELDNTGTDEIICTPLHWNTSPGWLASNTGSNAKQYRWPVLEISSLVCTEGRSHKNADSVWTMCGDDFTAYLDYNVPRPETCGNSAATIPCTLSPSAIANAKSIFGNNSKGKIRL